MKKCISTCLFNAHKYINAYLSIPKTVGILEMDFDVVIYHDDSVTNEMIIELSKYKCVKLIKKNRSKGRSGCFWRYEAYNDYDFIYFRDIDVSIEQNDKIIFNDFINSNYNIFWVFLVHQRKPYPNQGFLMGGVFGILKNNIISDINILIKNWELQKGLTYYGSDEEFLALVIYPLLKPIVYYEPRILNVKLKNDYETYKKLLTNFNL
tara:strand:- start:594 stop:1217 length:624 start_codon:yes stop_codon:yes gene_type:complete